mmetsp:Transcript_95190/g.165352  ORF Transcript_95190/g.165352 Transcript_95190/m.165352 type:complete len:191 (-) Transcript_95190:424-996(-)
MLGSFSSSGALEESVDSLTLDSLAMAAAGPTDVPALLKSTEMARYCLRASIASCGGKPFIRNTALWASSFRSFKPVARSAASVNKELDREFSREPLRELKRELFLELPRLTRPSAEPLLPPCREIELCLDEKLDGACDIASILPKLNAPGEVPELLREGTLKSKLPRLVLTIELEPASLAFGDVMPAALH